MHNARGEPPEADLATWPRTGRVCSFLVFSFPFFDIQQIMVSRFEVRGSIGLESKSALASQP